jgi:hypothetical protein
MMSDLNDEELRARFGALRKHDRATAPDFRQLLDYPEGTRRKTLAPVPSRIHWVAIAASLVLAAALVIGKSRQRNDARPGNRDIPSISTWQSPTAGLLNTPSRALIDPPPLLSSVFDGVTQTALPQTKAD